MIYKFRSMTTHSEDAGARLAAKGDARITPVGRVIRAIHFDELPQLFNILKGEMSVIYRGRSGRLLWISIPKKSRNLCYV